MGWSDGGHRYKGKSGGGWIIKAWTREMQQPVIVAAGSTLFPDNNVDSYIAEANALTALMCKIDDLIQQNEKQKLQDFKQIEYI